MSLQTNTNLSLPKPSFPPQPFTFPKAPSHPLSLYLCGYMYVFYRFTCSITLHHMTSSTRSLYYTLGCMQSVASWTVAVPIVIALLILGILAVVIAKLVLMFLVSGEQVCVCVHVCVCARVCVCVCACVCVCTCVCVL